MYDVLLGKQRGLVFPVMCNGAVVIDYSDNIPDSADDVGYGLWSNEGSFTLEAIVTPYDPMDMLKFLQILSQQLLPVKE